MDYQASHATGCWCGKKKKKKGKRKTKFSWRGGARGKSFSRYNKYLSRFGPTTMQHPFWQSRLGKTCGFVLIPSSALYLVRPYRFLEDIFATFAVLRSDTGYQVTHGRWRWLEFLGQIDVSRSAESFVLWGSTYESCLMTRASATRLLETRLNPNHIDLIRSTENSPDHLDITNHLVLICRWPTYKLWCIRCFGTRPPDSTCR